METLTRLVSESLARHGFDRPLDYRHLQWSRWFRCESHHSLLVVPSKPVVFALAEEITHLVTTAPEAESRGSEAASIRRMLAVTKFFEDDDMAFVLDRMLSHDNPMRSRMASGRYFIRFVEIHDQVQRRSICSALNQWILSSTEKATGIGSHFASSLELTPEPSSAARTHGSGLADSISNPKQSDEKRATTAPRLNSAVDTTIHCSSSFPSGF